MSDRFWRGSLGLATLALFLSTTCLAQSAGPASASVYVVRHAEKEDPSDPDTPLSAAGEARARSLAALLGGERVEAVYATEFKRTQQTGAPLAEAAGIAVTVIRNADQADLLARARAVGPGGRILIVGHSNTVPGIVHELTGEAVDGINENEFDNLYEVVFEADGRKRLVRSKYGGPPR